LFHTPVLWFCRKKRGKTNRKTWLFYLFEIKIATQGIFFFHISMYTCTLNPIGLSPLIFFILP
jgi:hypothetical protein